MADLEALLQRARQSGLAPGLRGAAVQTRWAVITGTYSSGKTTLVGEIASRWRVRAFVEPARMYYESLHTPVSGESFRGDVRSTVAPIHGARLSLESSLDPLDRLVLDTAVPDTLAYALLYDSHVDEVIAACSRFSYREPIIFLEPLALVRDGMRNEDDVGERLGVSFLRRKIYEMLGYSVVSVPAGSLDERIRAVLANLS